MDLIDSIVQRITQLTGGNLASLAIIVFCGVMAFSATKNVVKVLCGALIFLAALYIIDPNIYNTLLSDINDFVISLKNGVPAANTAFN